MKEGTGHMERELKVVRLWFRYAAVVTLRKKGRGRLRHSTWEDFRG